MTETTRQSLGRLGETLVATRCACPKCKRLRTLRRLPPNFKCADVICDFCGYLAQVKTATAADVKKVPASLLGAAWKPQYDRMQARQIAYRPDRRRPKPKLLRVLVSRDSSGADRLKNSGRSR